MTAMVKLLFDLMFFVDLLLAGFAATARLPKRDRFPLRSAGAVVFCLLVGGGWKSLVNSWSADPMAVTSVSYFVSFLLVMAAIALCVRLEGWSLLYMSTTIWFIQHTANCLDFIFFSGAMSLASFLRHLAVLLAVILTIYALFLRKIEAYVLDRMDLKMAAPIWSMMCVVCLVLNAYANNAGEATLSFRLADLAFNLVGLLYQSSLYHFCGLEREKEGVQTLLEQSRRQYQTSKENIERVNIKCHDLRHQISGFRRDGRLDETVLAELERVVSDYDTAIRTGNPALDTILTEKSILCSSKGIGFTCMAEGSCLSYMEPADLYALFGNALDNAIEAAERLNDVAKKQIAITVRRVKDFCSIHLQNYTEDRLTFADGLPVTTKADKHNHGFGVKSMRLLMAKYDGELTFTQDEDMVELSLLLPCRETAEYNL